MFVEVTEIGNTGPETRHINAMHVVVVGPHTSGAVLLLSTGALMLVKESPKHLGEMLSAAATARWTHDS